MKNEQLDHLRLELAVRAKSGADFIAAAAITWGLVTYIWTLDAVPYNKGIYTFIVGAVMLPLAFALSKVFKTEWNIPDNPLDSLGLVLNFAQLFYFPFLFFLLGKHPEYFVMGYVIITGAHFFPYYWYYNEIGFAIAAGVLSVGAFFLAQNVAPEQMWLVPLFAVVVLLLLLGKLLWTHRRKQLAWEVQQVHS